MSWQGWGVVVYALGVLSVAGLILRANANVTPDERTPRAGVFAFSVAWPLLALLVALGYLILAAGSALAWARWILRGDA